MFVKQNKKICIVREGEPLSGGNNPTDDYFNPLPRKRENRRNGSGHIAYVDISIHSLARGRTALSKKKFQTAYFNPLPRKRENFAASS